MFRPNNSGVLTRRLGYNVTGEATYRAPVTVQCAIVDNLVKAQKTPVRADSSADRGNSEENVAQVKILFPASVTICVDDMFAIAGMTLRMTGQQKRFSVTGRFDHIEVDFDILP